MPALHGWTQRCRSRPGPAVAPFEPRAGATVQCADVQRVVDVLHFLTPGPFTTPEFLGHVIGLNAIRNCSDMESILHALVERGDVRLGSEVGTWIVPA
ncbi:MAG: hypothetical protein JWN99_741 [Ilumatobacteraceae bacterium]|nr:hypothetical protein [Ilumatobacteraceae bacterium]